MYAAKGETDFGANPRTYVNNGVGYWGVLQGDMPSWPNPHDVRGQAQAFFTGRGPQGQTDFHVGAINWVRQGVTYPPEIAVRTEVPSFWPVDAYSPGGPAQQAANLAASTSVVDQVTGGGGIGAPGTPPPPPSPNVPNIVISGDPEQLIRQTDFAGMDINLWKELALGADGVAGLASAYLHHIQRTLFVTPHKAG